ncbi:hypothetical protein [Erythrobacter donghaensis]|jgi:hypothetical protein|nr:hypothetical protein [Erythrobacter donghaensis]
MNRYDPARHGLALGLAALSGFVDATGRALVGWRCAGRHKRVPAER